MGRCGNSLDCWLCDHVAAVTKGGDTMKFHRRGSSGPVAAPTAVLLAVGLTCSSGSAFAAGGAITEYAIPSGIGGFDIVGGPGGKRGGPQRGGGSCKKGGKG